MEILQTHWSEIRKKVIIPLWNKKFKSMYESIKMDYNDFESLSGIELTKAIKTFDSEKSNLFTYATNVINNKAMTELRDCTQRDVRKTLHISESMDALENSIIDNIPAKDDGFEVVFAENGKKIFSPKMEMYLNKLSKLQKQVLFALSEGFTNEEIIAGLKITPKELADACEAFRSYRNVSLLY